MTNERRTPLGAQTAHSRRRFIQLAAASGAAAGWMIACGSDNELTPPTSTAASSPVSEGSPGEPKHGGNFVMSDTDSPPHFDGTVAYNGRIHTALSFTRNRLLRGKFGPDVGSTPGPNEIEVDLAESWEQSDDLSVTLKLRDNVNWQNVAPIDGRKFVAEDVRLYFDHILDPANNSQLAGQFAALESVETPDDTTVVFTLKTPDAEFIPNLAFHYQTIAPPELFGEAGKTNPAGTGPFIFETIEQGERVTFKRNPDYFRGPLPYFDSVEYRTISNLASQFSAFAAGQLTAVHEVSLADLPGITRQVEGIQVTPAQDHTTHRLQVTPYHPPLDDARVRLAVQKLINQQQFIDVVWGGAEGATWSAVMPVNIQPYALPEDEARELLALDIAEAKSLLDAAGYDYDQTIELAWNRGYGDIWERLATVAQQQLLEGGVKTNIVSFEAAEFLQRWTEAPWDKNRLAVGPCNYYGTPDGLRSAYHPEGAFYFQDVNDPHLVEMALQQRRILDVDERVEYVREIQRYLHTENVIDIPMALPIYNAITQPAIRDYQFRMADSVYNYVEEAWSTEA